MTLRILVLPILLQLVIPLLLIARIGFGRYSSRAALSASTTLAGAYLAAIAIAGLWLALPRFFLWLWVALLTSAVIVRWRARGTLATLPATALGRVTLAAYALAALSALGVAGLAFSGRRAPREVVDLAFPLGSGIHLVLNGGANSLINAHFMTLGAEERFRAYRGQSYAVDIVSVNRWGLRAAGIQPKDLEAYVVFGHPVLAPCSGSVIRAVDGISDMTPPQLDREHMAGNHVILQCGAHWVVLGHLRNGSVTVTDGDFAATGQVLGAVGNTGNSAEPHLHVHAQTPAPPEAPLGGEPVHVRFDGRFLVRNALIRR